MHRHFSIISPRTLLTFSTLLGVAAWPNLSGCSRNVQPVEKAAVVESAPQAAPQAAPKVALKPSAPAAAEALLPGKLSGIQWESSFEAALAKAKKTNKLVMVDFFATWCGPCKMMDQQTYPDPAVVKASRNFVNVKVDVDKQQALAARYGVQHLPTFIWMDGSGKPVAKANSAALPVLFVQWMNQVSTKWTQTVTG